MVKRVLQNTFSLLNVDYVKLSTKWDYRNVISPYYRIYYIDEGSGEISDQLQRLQLEAGYLYIIPSFTLCNLHCNGFLSQYFVQFFEESVDGISLFAQKRTVSKIKASAMDIDLFKRLLEINPGRGINRSDDPKVYEKNIFYKEYQELNNRQSLASYLETQGILLQLMGRLLQSQLYLRQESHQTPVKIAETVSYILINLNQELSVTALASRLNQHPDYFSRLFKTFTGERPVTYILGKRIERAQYLLATSQLTYSEIATQTGFDNLSYFSRSFKKLTGMSPGAYKKQVYKVGFTL
ncbi:helix-turn-helix transcriptional regulator [Pedobacter sp. HDW13]|uniref:helix-turn-helix domain-containing protein n=1 Tax=unclassified Pedobacter TaxID=2628915 RepID=UPI000F596622|nr:MULTISPECIES: AraC family transcriptional regulator [unclassified Pedobacter]QIL38229.1 helix-turn-helix transcriptional regulator [Pedobacter sp. HDW13]RQO64436.1 AraC family transcriptional regulator [Pedobacter sp. KBW01]